MGVPDTTVRTSPVPPSPDRQAQDLISANRYEECLSTRVDDVACARKTDGEAVGTTIGAMAYRDPTQAREVFDKVREKTPDADERREVARGIGEYLPPDLLRRLGATPDGRAMLERARAELRGKLGDDDSELAAAKIGNALKAADLEKSAQFKALDPATQQTALTRIGSPTTGAAAVDNLVALVTSPGFQAASPATRGALLDALSQHPKDTIFRQGLESLADDAVFKGRTPAQQASALSAFNAAARTESYRGREGTGHFGSGETTVRDADKRQVLANAQRVITADGFQDVGPDTQKALMNVAGRAVKLVEDPGFLALNDAGKATRLLTAYGKDAAFAKGMDTLLGDAKFTSLKDDGDRARVLGDVVKMRGTDSYKQANASDRQALIEIVGNLAAQSEAKPLNTTLRNTVDQVVDGNVTLKLYKKAPVQSGGQPFYTWGKADPTGVYLNTHPDVRAKATADNKYIDALPHEVNHKLNGITESGTADRFLDEYRAAVVGTETAIGKQLTPAQQLRKLNNLVDGTNPSYAHLAELYHRDPDFKAAIDRMYSALAGSIDPVTGTVTTPFTVSPEDARKRLLDAGNSSDYLNKAGNLDNR